MEEKKELPKTGGSDSAPLLGLGAGALLVGGGLLIRRIAR
jgi:LPXTG-motif cell wall-anchored protein